jgi:preprotein translocase subunit SecB
MTDPRQPQDAPLPQVKADGENNAQPQLVVNAQYVKDLSFEAPGAPQVFGQLQRQQPNISVRWTSRRAVSIRPVTFTR